MKEIFTVPSPKKNKIYAYCFGGTFSSMYSKFIYKEKVWVLIDEYDSAANYAF